MSVCRRWWSVAVLCLMLVACQAPVAQPPVAPTPLSPTAVPRQVERFGFQQGAVSLRFEVLDDDLIHFSYAPASPQPDWQQPISTTVMINQTTYPGPTSFQREAERFRTAAAQVVVDPNSLCFSLSDLTRALEARLTTICPVNIGQAKQGLTMTAEQTTHLYGLGQHFLQPGQANGDWLGQIIEPGNAMGNAMVNFSGGFAGNTQFPVMYALGRSGETYAMLLDHPYAITWDLRADPWKIQTGVAPLRGYLMTGSSLLALRRAYMELVGRPLVPPKAMFGLWVSEFGYDNWAELQEKLQSLRQQRFPVDGFVLDLEWFGGVRRLTRMGSLSWDQQQFPEPAKTIQRLRQEQGIGLMLIEESYVDISLPEYDDLAQRGFMPRMNGPSGDPMRLRGWWGTGGMLDWTNPAAADYWHDTKRQPLVEAGVIGHWTDLGEPELFHFKLWYYGFPEWGLFTHRDVHNLYNFKWLESIQRGYARHTDQRPFMMSRSGTTGIQRFGASMWSGDLASNMGALQAHMRSQMHMSFSGIDYYGSDIGGFVRRALDGDQDQLYTQWFANSMLLDIPARPHTDNQCNCHETAPDRIGDPASNLANLRLRYRLIPYLYSLAHQAYLHGDPVFPPLVLAYQNDPNVATIADQKMIGPNLMVATTASYTQTSRDLYLPAGVWFDYHTNQRYLSQGEWLRGLPTVVDGRVQLPLLARAGAIVPEMLVDDQTMNALGQRLDQTRRDPLIIRVYADSVASQFRLFEDDGTTIAYQRGMLRTTDLSQQLNGNRWEFTLAAAVGSYTGAQSTRQTELRVVLPAGAVRQVQLNGTPIPSVATLDTQPGWLLEQGVLRMSLGEHPVDQTQQVVVELGQ